jgi:hypothetical protein
VRRVVVDPALIAAGICGVPDCRRLLGLLALGRWAQYIELTGPAEEAKLQEEIGAYGGRRGGPSETALLDAARDRRAALVGVLPVGVPDDLVLATSPRLSNEVAQQVQHWRESLPAAAADPALVPKARRLVTAITGELIGSVEDPLQGSLYDHLIHVAAEASAPIVTDDPELAAHEGSVYRLADPRSGRPAFTLRFWTFHDREIDRWPFSLGSVPLDLLERALRSF